MTAGNPSDYEHRKSSWLGKIRSSLFGRVLGVFVEALAMANPAGCGGRTFGERWVLVGEYTTPREKAGPPKETGLGPSDFPTESSVALSTPYVDARW
jgi:hypothetical protein